MSNHDDYYGTRFMPFFGVVEAIIDQSYVRVRVFNIHPFDDKSAVPTEMLPPALVLFPTGGGQVTSGAATHNLEIDSWVHGYFMDYPKCMQLIVTHVINGGDYSASTYASGGGEFVGQGSEDYPDQGEVGTLNLKGNSNMDKAYWYIHDKLVAEGASSNPAMHTAAAMGSLILETTTINPTATNGNTWGIAQWLGSRKRALIARYGGKTPRLDHQLDFMWWELNNEYRGTKANWLRATNLVEATAAFTRFESNEMYTNGVLNRAHPYFKRVLKYAMQTENTYNNRRPPDANPETGTATPRNRGGEEL